MLLVTNTGIFLHQYFVHFPVDKSRDWFWAYQPLFEFLNQKQNRQKQVFFVFAQPEFLDQVHIFTLFYNRIDPAVYLANGGTRLGRFGTTGEFSIDRFHFIPDDCRRCGLDLQVEDQDLIVVSKPIAQKTLTIVKSLDGIETLYVYQAGQLPLKKAVDFFKPKTPSWR